MYVDNFFNLLHLLLAFVFAQAVAMPDQWEFGYPDNPEMNDYRLQLQQFMLEWEKMQSTLNVTHSLLETGGKSPRDLLQEMILQMESECNPMNHIPEFLVTPKVYPNLSRCSFGW